MRQKRTKMSVYSGCVVFGVGLGFLISYFIGWGYGMPAGVLIGIGAGMVLDQLPLI